MIRNFYEMEPKLQSNCHRGEGTVRIVNIFDKFETNIPFFHYTVLPPGSSIGLHTHKDDNEFYVVLKGEGEMEVDGVKEAVTAGCAIKNRPFGTHGLRNTSDTEDLELLVFEVKN